MGTTTARPGTTILVVPRENFSFARDSLESIIDHTPANTPMVYVDGGSPRRVRDYLETAARCHDFTLLRTEHYLVPNEARNLALPQVSTEFVALVDNDVLVEPGWLEALEDCARATGAWLVGPLILYRRGGDAPFIHHAGGVNRIVAEGARRVHIDTHAHEREDPVLVAPTLTRHQTESVEYHCALARTSALEALGPFDEQYLSFHDHCDLSLLVLDRDGTIWFEPGAVVTYLPPVRLALSDLPYAVLRWSDRWNLASNQHHFDKWDLTPDERTTRNVRETGVTLRNKAYLPYRSPFSPIIRRVLRRRPRLLPDRILQSLIYRRETARRSRREPPVVVHRSSRAP